MVEIGTLTFCAPLRGPSLAIESEELGFDYQLFGVNECQTTDVFSELRMAAEATSRIRLGCGVANFVTRHPCVVASAIAAIQVASGGRALCAVGKGDSAVGRIGLRPQRHADFTRDLQILQAYLAGRSTKVNGVESRISWLEGSDYEKVPVEVAGTGPKTLAAAGAHADRVALAVGAAPERIDWAFDIVRSAASAAGRDPAQLRIGAHLPVWISDSREEAIEELRPHVVGWAHMASFDARQVATHDPILRKVTSVVHEGYDYDHHGVEESRTSPVRHLADDDFVDYYGIAGPASYVIERLAALVEKGLSFVTVVGLGEQKQRLAHEVAPALRAI
ncbi:MAG: LLM class flavin-dependent oxidoreductase [Deltaproteobacteria bacterium]|jgi:5,10-methylenetetrahydromethanopterin reductase|nr:LLM class flavin-dependent oxidoreductase [Deltaproteobacteria bacterium]